MTNPIAVSAACCNPLRKKGTEEEDGKPEGEQRRRVAESPGKPELPGAASRALPSARHERRHRDEVIRIGRMAQSEKNRDSENDPDRSAVRGCGDSLVEAEHLGVSSGSGCGPGRTSALGERAAPAAASPSARVSSTTATAGSGASSRELRPHVVAELGRDGRARGSDGSGRKPRCSPGLGDEARGQCAHCQSPGHPRWREPAGRVRQLVDDELAGRRRHQETSGPRLTEHRGQGTVRTRHHGRHADLAAQAGRGSEEHAAHDHTAPADRPTPRHGTPRGIEHQKPTDCRMSTTWMRPGCSWWISRIFPT